MNNQRFTPDQVLETKLAAYKIPVVLFAFHALQYPEQHPDQAVNTVDDGISPVDVGELYDLPERFVKDPGNTPREKASWFCRQFRPIGRTILLRTAGITPAVDATNEIMSAGWEKLTVDDPQTDNQGNPLEASQILPPRNVIQSMLASSMSSYSREPRRSRSLERFIERVYRHDPEFPRLDDAS